MSNKYTLPMYGEIAEAIRVAMPDILREMNLTSQQIDLKGYRFHRGNLHEVIISVMFTVPKATRPNE